MKPRRWKEENKQRTETAVTGCSLNTAQVGQGHMMRAEGLS